MDARTSFETQRDFLIKEADQLRGEINARISLQNAAVQRGLALFGVVGTITSGVTAAVIRARAVDEALLSAADTLLLAELAFLLVVVFGGLIELLICNWVYQLYMIFRLNIYIGWTAAKFEREYKLPARSVLPWARGETPTAVRNLDRRRFRYLQAGVMYALVGISIGFATAIGVWVGRAARWPDVWPEVLTGSALVFALLAALGGLLWIHVGLIRMVEAQQRQYVLKHDN